MSFIIFILVGTSFSSFTAAAEGLGGVVSPYTARLEALSKSMVASKQFPVPKGPEIELKCFSTPGNELYIGVEQKLKINAPLAAVTKVIDDIDHYADIFPGYSDIHVISREGDRLTSYWEQTVPIPFVPNVKYEMLYRLETIGSDQKLYRYQLKKSEKLLKSDGFVLVRADGEKSTLFYEIDFFDAKWGSAKIFGKRKLWSNVLEDMAASDYGIKLRAEHSDWNARKVRRESRDLVGKQDCQNVPGTFFP